MKRTWDIEELVEHFTLLPQDMDLLANKTGPTRLGFAALGVRLPQEVLAATKEVPASGGRGQPPKPRPAPLYRVKQLIETLPESAWQTIGWREGTKGTMQTQAVAMRVHWVTGSQRHSSSHRRVPTGPEGWLLAERPRPVPKSQEPSTDEPVSADDTARPQVAGEQEAPQTKYWFSSLPPETSLVDLITLAHARWVIEQFDEDAKQECGLDDFQGRRWDGLHRHLALVILAYSFLALQRLQLPLPPGEDFPPSVTRSSLPHVHRQVLLWLFQALVLWLVQTDQIASFRPRRNSRSRTSPTLLVSIRSALPAD
jgi:hypothetical protein